MLAAIVGSAALTLASAAPASATDLTVTTVEDTIDGGDGVVSLREAVLESAATTTTADRIVLAAATYELDLCGDVDEAAGLSGDLDHSTAAASPLTIAGNGATIDQTCAGERVLDTATATVTLEELTLTGGTSAGAGGGIRFAGGGVLHGATVTGNAAGGLAASAGVTVEDSTISDNTGPGLLASGGAVVIRRTTIAGNGSAAVSAGGLITSPGVASLTVEDSTFTENSGLHAGAVRIEHTAASVISNSTLHSNHGVVAGATGGISSTAGIGATLLLVSNTISGNSVVSAADPTSVRTGAGSLAAVATVIVDGIGSTTDCQHNGLTGNIAANVVETGAGCPAGAYGAQVAAGAAQLGPLQDNGGPTATQIPANGSPLIDLVYEDFCDVPSDGRGLPRLTDTDFDGVAKCEAGSVELPRGQQFTDVPVDHTFFPEIGWMGYWGVSTGYQPGPTYRPSAGVTRQAMAAFLQRITQVPDPVGCTQEFSDVPVTHPFFTEICWMVEDGITTGFPDGSFRPGAVVTRQSMAAFMHRAAGSPSFTPPADPTFLDVSATNTFFTEIEWMNDTGITTGFPGGLFKPNQAVTRQAMSAFMFRFSHL